MDPGMSQGRLVTADVRRALSRRRRRGGWIQGGLLLAASAAGFAALGYLKDDWSWSYALYLVAVIFIHEMGHAAGMWIFGYRNVRVFFVPLIGAATLGRKPTATAAQRAVVLLLGPLPGIVAGFALGVGWLQTRWEPAGTLAVVFLGFNALQLLPIAPLDGGKLIATAFLTRHPLPQALLQLGVGVPMLAAGCVTGAWLLLLLGTVACLAPLAFLRGRRLALEFQKEQTPAPPRRDTIPEDYLEPLARTIQRRSPRLLTPDELADEMYRVWELYHLEPPTRRARIAILAAYLMLLLATPAVPALYGYASYREELLSVDGGAKRTLVATIYGCPLYEAELDADGFYDGTYVGYYPVSARVRERGAYRAGFWQGTWRRYDAAGACVYEADFEDGRCLRAREYRNGQWKTKMLPEVSMELHERYFSRRQTPPMRYRP